MRRILPRLAELETNPRPTDAKKLKGRKAWRIRVGDYRIGIVLAGQTATFVRFLNRKDIYKYFP